MEAPQRSTTPARLGDDAILDHLVIDDAQSGVGAGGGGTAAAQGARSTDTASSAPATGDAAPVPAAAASDPAQTAPRVPGAATDAAASTAVASAPVTGSGALPPRVVGSLFPVASGAATDVPAFIPAAESNETPSAFTYADLPSKPNAVAPKAAVGTKGHAEGFYAYTNPSPSCLRELIRDDMRVKLYAAATAEKPADARRDARRLMNNWSANRLRIKEAYERMLAEKTETTERSYREIIIKICPGIIALAGPPPPHQSVVADEAEEDRPLTTPIGAPVGATTDPGREVALE